jgi:filamentous hemagglutinin
MVGDKIFPGVAHEQVLAMTSQLLGMTVAAAAGGSDKDQQVAGWVAQQATVNNYLNHKEVESLIEEAKTCVASNSCDQVRNKFADLNDANEKRFALFCLDNPQGCRSPELQKFVEDYNDTHDLLSKARASDDVPAGMKSVLATAQMMNAVAKMRLLEMGLALGLTQAGSNAAGRAGINVDPETVGVFATWTAILFGAGKAVGASGVRAASQKLPTALPDNLTGYANPKDIRFTQDSVSSNFKDGQTLQSTIDGLKSGRVSPDDFPPIRVFEKDGAVYSLDNRRLLAASEAGVPIKVVPATAAEVAKEGRKVTTPNKGSIICVRGVCK